MVVIESLGLAVSVRINDGINDTAVPEYNEPEPVIDDNFDPEYTTICNRYVESQDDKNFVVVCEVLEKHRWIYEKLDNCLVVRLYIDGKRQAAKIASAKDFRLGRWTTRFEGFEQATDDGQAATLSRFRFSAVTMVDQSDARSLEKDRKRAKDIGLIQVVIAQHRRLGDSTSGRSRTENEVELSIAEKALKGRAISHGTTYSPAIPCPRLRFVSTEPLRRHALAVFNLKYRSRAALQTEMIIPRSPSPNHFIAGALDEDESPSPPNKGPTQMKAERMQARNQRGGVKREHSEVFDLTGGYDGPRQRMKIVKREGNVAEMIDLTDD